MDLLAEYEEMKSLPVHIAVAYKFFGLFKFEGSELVYVNHHGGEAEDDTLGALKAFLKSQRADLRVRDSKMGKGECSRRMWFWYQKLLELKMFDVQARMEIMKWMEVCELVLF